MRVHQPGNLYNLCTLFIATAYIYDVRRDTLRVYADFTVSPTITHRKIYLSVIIFQQARNTRL